MTKIEYDITFRYSRNTQGEPKGVYCVIRYPKMFMRETGFAKCNPADNFNKHIGRKLAFTRAVNNHTKPLRTALWEKFHDKQWRGEVFV